MNKKYFKLRLLAAAVFNATIFALLFILGVCSPARAETTHYDVVDLFDLFGVASRAIAVNSGGHVLVTKELKSYLLKDGGIIPILPPTGTGSFVAQALNDSDEVVGIVDGRPARWKAGVIQYLLGGQTQGTANAINNIGEVVGEYFPQEGGYRAYKIDAAGVFTDQGKGSLFDINDSGTMVGFRNDLQGNYLGAIVIQLNGSTQILPRSAVNGYTFLYNFADQIESDGTVLGSGSLNDLTLSPEGFVYDQSGLRVIASPWSQFGALIPKAKNGSGTIMGSCSAPAYTCLADGSQIEKISDRIVGYTNSGWSAVYGYDMNSAGLIVGTAAKNGARRAILLVPVSGEPIATPSASPSATASATPTATITPTTTPSPSITAPQIPTQSPTPVVSPTPLPTLSPPPASPSPQPSLAPQVQITNTVAVKRKKSGKVTITVSTRLGQNPLVGGAVKAKIGKTVLASQRTNGAGVAIFKITRPGSFSIRLYLPGGEQRTFRISK